MISLFKLICTACAFAMLAACGNDTNHSPDVIGRSKTLSTLPVAMQMSVDSYSPPIINSPKAGSPMVARNLSDAPVPKVIDLGSPAAALSAAASKNTSEAMLGKPLQISIGRNVAQTINNSATNQMLNWKTVSSGNQIAAISITSADAKSLRIGLAVSKLPESARLRFYTKGSTTANEISGLEILKSISLNIASGDKTEAGRIFWSPITTGSEATIEIEIPAGVSINDVEIAIPQISHFFSTVNEAAETALTSYSWASDGLSCQIDVSCSPIPIASNAVANLFFTVNGSTYSCTGTLLNNSASNGIPYLYTANHCIADQTTASSLVTLWFYKSSSCNSTYGTYDIIYGGAALKYTAADTDSTLLQLNNPAPAGALFAGWDASMQPLNSVFTGISHPRADSQRKSTGSIQAFLGNAIRNSAGYFSFSSSTMEKSTFYQIRMSSGVIEPGSSGSALFKNITSSNPQVVAVATAAQAASCSSSSVSNPQDTYYGRFDFAYAAGMSEWLSPGRKAVYRFYNTSLGTHFFTMDGIERNSIIAKLPQYNYEGVSFYAYSTQAGASGLSPVFRFFNTRTGAHFYTINVGERDNVIATLPQYSYEGIKWYAQTSNNSGTTPLYRFFHTMNGTHFYTINSVERDNVINLLPVYSYENVAYNVWQTQ
jgi:lysyl endopeptidase